MLLMEASSRLGMIARYTCATGSARGTIRGRAVCTSVCQHALTPEMPERPPRAQVEIAYAHDNSKNARQKFHATPTRVAKRHLISSESERLELGPLDSDTRWSATRRRR